MIRYQVQVTGDWAGSGGSWRPAIDGTLNQTDKSAAEASTFRSEAIAYEVLCDCENDADAAGDTAFRVVEVRS